MEINTHATSNAANMILFDRIKTGNPLLDTLVLTLLLSTVTGFLKWINNHVLENINFKNIEFKMNLRGEVLLRISMSQSKVSKFSRVTIDAKSTNIAFEYLNKMFSGSMSFRINP